MTFVECLGDDLFSFPKFIQGDSFEEYLKNEFEQYQLLLSKISETIIQNEVNKHKSKIEEICRFILDSIKLKEKGLLNKSYQKFEEALEILAPYLQQNVSTENKLGDRLEIPFYRIRIGNNYPFSKKEIFHIPFSKRDFANTQRYSVPGYPCLYLSNSIYTCWEEMDRPSINSFQVSRFQKENENMKILDLTLTRNRLRIQLESFASSRLDSNSIYHQLSIIFIITWPLFLICSLSTKNKAAPFKPEYIFPQYLLNWIIERGYFDGIKYFSTKCQPLSIHDFSKFINYVFPPKNFEKDGHCSFLTESFKISEPFSYELFLLSNPDFFFNPRMFSEYKNLYYIKKSLDPMKLTNGVIASNNDSLFYRMERLFDFIEVDYIK